MSNTFTHFRSLAEYAIGNDHLQEVLDNATRKMSASRVDMLNAIAAPDELRDQLKQIRSNTLADLDIHLETFEKQAKAVGAQVHWAAGEKEVNKLVLEIARKHNVHLVTKSKSMVSEELHLNQSMLKAGIQVVETDLGEWIIQLANQPPFHIIVPAIHLTRQEAAQLMSKEAGYDLPPDDIQQLVSEARRLLREKFLAAEMGITGANLAIAESGTIVLVTNEGNAEMVTSLPPVHIVVMGIEKLVPRWEDASVWLSLLARCATGQPLSIYTNFITGPAHPDELDGPEELHIILVDHGRSRLVGTKYEEVLQCIRCGACLNACPVYGEIGGHTYGSPYSGPIGAVVSPLLFGLKEYEALPHASTLCGACLEVCPARIDLPRMLLQLRNDEVEQRILPWYERLIERLAAWILSIPILWRLFTEIGRFFQKPLVERSSLRLPRWLNPAKERKLPSLGRKSFRELWRSGKVG